MSMSTSVPPSVPFDLVPLELLKLTKMESMVVNGIPSPYNLIQFYSFNIYISEHS